jgi:hypothetical protein
MRPHQALDVQVPAIRYSSNPRLHQEQQMAPEDAEKEVIRKIQRGRFRYWMNREFSN